MVPLAVADSVLSGHPLLLLTVVAVRVMLYCPAVRPVAGQATVICRALAGPVVLPGHPPPNKQPCKHSYHCA